MSPKILQKKINSIYKSFQGNISEVTDLKKELEAEINKIMEVPSNLSGKEEKQMYPLRENLMIGIVRLMVRLNPLEYITYLLKILERGYYTDDDKLKLNTFRSLTENNTQWDETNIHSIIHKMKNNSNSKVWIFFIEDYEAYGSRNLSEIGLLINRGKILNSNVVIGCILKTKEIKIVKNRFANQSVDDIKKYEENT